MSISLGDGEGVVQAVQEGGGGSDHHQRVHIGMQFDEVFGSVDEKVSSADEYRDGEHQLDEGEVERIDSVVDDGRQRQTHRQHMGHPDVQHQRAANQRDNQPPFADGVGECNADFLRVGKAAGKAGFVDDFHQHLLADRRVAQDSGTVSGKVDIDLEHPVGAPQRTLHRGGAGSTGHSLDVDFDVFGLRSIGCQKQSSFLYHRLPAGRYCTRAGKEEAIQSSFLLYTKMGYFQEKIVAYRL